MKFLIFSDLHLGSPLFDKRVEVINLLKSDDFDTIILNGDILDSWEWPIDIIKKNNASMVKTLQEVSIKKPTYYIIGNHDPDLVLLQETFPDMIFKDCLQIDDIFIIHGCEFDILVQKYSLMARVLFTFSWISQRIFRYNLKEFFKELLHSVSNKKNEPYYNDLVNDVDKKAIEKYSPICDYLILGHTHFPKIIDTDSCKYINCGDMIHNNTYVVADSVAKTFDLKKV